jgi:hypothetical protein
MSLPAEGIVAAFQFAERRQVRWQLGNQVTSTVPVAEGVNSGHGALITSCCASVFITARPPSDRAFHRLRASGREGDFCMKSKRVDDHRSR